MSEETMTVKIIDSLRVAVDYSDYRTKKLFYKQKQFMERFPNYPSLGRKKLKNIVDKYNNQLWEIRLDRKRRIVYVEREGNLVIWLKICSHDELVRKNIINVSDSYR